MKRLPCQILVAIDSKEEVINLTNALNDINFKLDSDYRKKSLFSGKENNNYPLCISIIPSKKIYRPVNSITMIAMISDTEQTQPFLYSDVSSCLDQIFHKKDKEFFWNLMEKVIKDKNHPKAELIIEGKIK